MRRDLDIDCDPAELVLAPPDRSQLTEMFRRFEFRGLLQRVDLLDEALPAAAPREVEGDELPWREGDVPTSPRVESGSRPTATGAAVADGGGRRRRPATKTRRRGGSWSCTTPRRCASPPGTTRSSPPT